MKKIKFSGKKFKYGSMTAIFTVLFIAAAVVLNIFVNIATDRLGLRIDLTDNRLYEISDETKLFLKNDLKEDIKITVLSSETTYIDNQSFSPIREVLLRYVALSNGKISIDYVDPYVNPEIVDKYNENGDVAAHDIIVESGKRFKVLNPTDLYAIKTNYETSEQYVAGIQAEQKLSSAVMYCVVDELPVALKVEGHSETNMPKLNSLLVSGNYKVDSVNLSLADIPDNCEMLIISSPKTDFTVDEIKKLDAFFDRNGNAMVFYDISVPELPVFERFMADWGVRFDNVLVGDEKQSISYPTTLAPSLLSHDMVKDLAKSGEYVIVPAARQISALYQEQGWRKVSPILQTSDAAYGKTIKSGVKISNIAKEPGDLSGPFNVCVLTEQDRMDDMQHNYSRILFGATGMASDDTLSVDSFLNTRFLTRAINYMNQSADSIVIEPKYYTSTKMNILGNQAAVVFWVLVIIIPVGTLILGFIMWIRRRNM